MSKIRVAKHPKHKKTEWPRWLRKKDDPESAKVFNSPAEVPAGYVNMDGSPWPGSKASGAASKAKKPAAPAKAKKPAAPAEAKKPAEDAKAPAPEDAPTLSAEDREAMLDDLEELDQLPEDYADLSDAAVTELHRAAFEASPAVEPEE